MSRKNPFEDLENKDLAANTDDLEGKMDEDAPQEDPEEDPAPETPEAPAAADSSAVGETTLVEMLHHDRHPGTDENLIPGDVVEVPDWFAVLLIDGYRAKALG